MLKKMLFLFAATLVAGCANWEGRPEVAYLAPGPEYKLKSAAHWQIIANDISSQVRVVAEKTNSPVFVPSDTGTSFGRVFPSMLRSGLLKQGVTVLDRADQAALAVTVKVDSVEHVNTAHYKPGTLSTLATGVLVARYGFDSANAAAASTAGLLIGADAITSIEQRRSRPTTEVVLTVSIEKSSAYVMHETSAYYIDAVDRALFEKTGKQYAVVGSAK